MKLISSILGAIAPHECLGCSAENRLLCDACFYALPQAEQRCFACRSTDNGVRTCPECRRRTPLAAVHAAVMYETHAKSLLWKLKFGRARYAAEEIAAAIRPIVAPVVADGWIITHVPAATTHVRRRGYDQAELIAQSLAKTIGLPCAPLLARSGQSKQVGSDRESRLRQLSGVYRPLRSGLIKGSRILLIDDVVTTGATLHTAAKVLNEAGAERIEAAVFAQA